MPPIALKFAATKRSGFPEVATVNCLAERDPNGGSEPLALIARPGLTAFETIGTAPTRMLWQKQGLFANSALVLASQTIYTLSASGASAAYTGSIAGDDLVEVDGGLDADGNSIARVATGSALYSVQDTGVVTQETFPDSGNAGATSVGYLSGYWLASAAGTDAVYYQVPASTTWNALQFASAEYAPDKIVFIRVVGEIAWLGGETTLEGWRVTGDATAPLAPVGGLKFDVGCRAKSTAVNCRGTLIFVDNDCSVRMTGGGEPTIISDAGLAEQIRRAPAGDLRASFFVKDQHPVYVLTLGTDATWLYDLAGQAWTRADSRGYDYWRSDLFANLGDVALARDVLSNQIYSLDPDVRDDDGDTFARVFSAYLETKERPVPVANLELHCAVGGAPLAGQGSDPLIGMQWSKNGGKTWSQIRYRGLGQTGKYGTRVRWNGLGQADAPQGMWFRFFVSDPTVTRISGASVNVP